MPASGATSSSGSASAVVLPELPGLVLVLRRSSRARRLSLRVSRSDGGITLTVPLRTSLAEARAFASAHSGWLRTTLAALPPLLSPTYGSPLPFEGRDLVLTQATNRVPRVEGDRLLLSAPPETLPIRLEAWLKTCARGRLVAATEHHASTLGRAYEKITLRDTRSRWGSCTAQGALNYSWRLIMAPPSVLNYVAAHEVAHLAQMNHSHAFWAVVAQLCPGYAQDRLWLKREGARLQAIRFRG